jgi:hypothetical protein
MVEARSICIVIWPKICGSKEQSDTEIHQTLVEIKKSLPILHKGHYSLKNVNKYMVSINMEDTRRITYQFTLKCFSLYCETSRKCKFAQICHTKRIKLLWGEGGGITATADASMSMEISIKESPTETVFSV